MIYRFANCSLDSDRHVLLRDDIPVHVEPQVFDLLHALAESHDRLVTKDELVEIVWRGLSVSDSTISARINAARKAVGDTGKSQSVIKTVHGRGFQLVAGVETENVVGRTEAASQTGQQTIRFVQSSNGARIAYAQSGSGPPLVRIGHWLSHLELDWRSPVWLPLVEALGKNHTLYRYDQRGTGLSSRGVEGAGLDAFVEDLESVANANNLKSFPIFAASQAVPVAVRFAERFPERISGLVLYGGYVKGRALRSLSPDDVDESTVLALIRAGWGKEDSPFMSALSSLYMPDATPGQLSSFVKMQLETITPDKAATLRQIVDRFDVQDSLRSIKAPTLVVHAIDDAINPIEQGRILASEIPNARFLPLESRNHVPLPQEESWGRMMSEVTSFLDQLR